MDAGLLDVYGSENLGIYLRTSETLDTIVFGAPKGLQQSYRFSPFRTLPTGIAMVTVDSNGQLNHQDIPTGSGSGSIDLTDYLTKTEASNTYQDKQQALTDLISWFSNAVDGDILVKGITTWNTLKASNYYTKSQVDSTFASQLSLGQYLTKSEASSNYAPIGSIPNLSNYLSKTEASSTYLSKVDAGSQFIPVTVLGSLLTEIEAAGQYQPINSGLTALSSSWATDTSQNNLIPKRSGNTLIWVPLPDTTGFVTSAQLSGLLKADGSVPISATFTPTNDRDLVYKAWVEQKIQAASIGGGGTPPDLSTYLLKTEAASIYQPKGSALDALQASWISAATDNMKIPQRQGNSVVWINLPDLTGYITEAAADTKYELSNVTLKKLVTWWSSAPDNAIPVKDGNGTDRWKTGTLPDLAPYITRSEAGNTYQTKGSALDALQTSWASDSTQNGKIPQRQGGSIIWIDPPSGGTGGSVDLTPYLTKAEAASTYARISQIPDVTVFYTKTETDSKFVTNEDHATDLLTKQPASAILTTLVSSFTAAANSTFFGKDAAGHEGFFPVSGGGSVDLSDYYTKTEADDRYFIKSSFPELEAFATTSQSATNGYIPRKQGNTFSWVAANTLGLKIQAKNDSLTGDLVLTSSSEQYQFLNGGLLDRKVTLPTGATGLFFVIQNDGTKLINVHNDVNTLISTIYPKHITGFFWNGSNWAQSHTIDASITAKTSVNKQTLTADLILVPSSPVYQYLDPGTANRAVTLPAGFTGAQFIIQNTGTGAFSLLIKNSAGTPLLTTYARWTSLFEWNGTAWEFRQIQDASNVTIYGGTATLGSLVIGPTTTAGKRSIALTNNAGSFTIGATPTAARIVDFQDKNGIVALMSDIPDMTGYYTKTEVDNQFTVLQGTLPNMANYFTKTEANNQFAAKVQVDPIATRTAYLDNPVTAALPDTTITVGNLKALKIGTTYTVPNGNINKLFAITLPGVLTSPSSYLHRLTEYNYLLTVNVVNGVGERLEFEYFITWNPTQADSDAVGTGKFVAELIATSQSLSESTFHGRYATVTTKITAPTLGIVNTQNGRLMVCSNSATTVQIVQENTAPGFEDSVFRNDTEIGLYALGGNVTVQVAAPCTLNDANTPIVINRYQMRVLKRFDTANKWYLI